MKHRVVASTVVLVSTTIGATAVAQITERVSVGAGGVQASLGSDNCSISRDGRFVAFESVASNLVSDDTNHVDDVFVRDRLTGETIRASVGTGGIQANQYSGPAKISADGGFVVFLSVASNLAPDGRGGVFVRDLLAGTTERVFAGQLVVTSPPDVSPDGRFVVFVAVPAWGLAGVIHLVDRTTGMDEIVPTPAGNRDFDPTVSASGRYVAFDDQRQTDPPRVLRWDRSTGDVVEIAGVGSSDPVMSEFGTDVAFTTDLSLDPVDEGSTDDAYVTSFARGGYSLVSLATDGAPADRPSELDSMSLDGSFLAFTSAATNLRAREPQDPPSSTRARHVYVHDRVSGLTVRASVSSSDVSGNFDSYDAAIFWDGRHVAFVSEASNLVDGDSNGYPDVFVRTVTHVRIDGLAVTVGSESGGDVVRIDGGDLTSLGGCRVTFSGVGATVLNETPDHVIVRTPPGRGTVDVRVSNLGGASTAQKAFSYVPARFAALYGNVAAATGARDDVLRILDSTGDPFTRVVTVHIGAFVSLGIQAPAATPRARYVVYGWRGAPTISSLRSTAIGSFVLPTPFTSGVPRPTAIWNTLGHRRTLGQPTARSFPGSSPLLALRHGIPRRSQFTFQGLVEDQQSANAIGLSVTNAIVLSVVP